MSVDRLARLLRAETAQRTLRFLQAVRGPACVRAAGLNVPVLPTATLSLIFLATYLRVMRASMLEVLDLEFVRTARAKGVSEPLVVLRPAPARASR